MWFPAFSLDSLQLCALFKKALRYIALFSDSLPAIADFFKRPTCPTPFQNTYIWLRLKPPTHPLPSCQTICSLTFPSLLLARIRAKYFSFALFTIPLLCRALRSRSSILATAYQRKRKKQRKSPPLQRIYNCLPAVLRITIPWIHVRHRVPWKKVYNSGGVSPPMEGNIQIIPRFPGG